VSASRVWLVLQFGSDRQYGGNAGYDDRPEVYRYDSFVPNHLQVAAGDLLILRDRERMLGAARVATVSSCAGTKVLRKCPSCGTTGIKERTTRVPLFRCKRGHEFEAPVEQEEPCINFVAELGDSFSSAPEAVSLEALRAACPRHADQLSIQELKISVLATLGGHATLAPLLLAEAHPGERQGAYELHATDTRTAVLRQIRARQGRAEFRDGLITRYGRRCMVTGCSLMDIVEAAHISPYRGIVDNHPENGLLLRADIHTLFDRNLLGIHPETLEVVLRGEVADAGYAFVSGAKVATANVRPSRASLMSRWGLFSLGYR
jgi:putative restriction endonuclease